MENGYVSLNLDNFVNSQGTIFLKQQNIKAQTPHLLFIHLKIKIKFMLLQSQIVYASSNQGMPQITITQPVLNPYTNETQFVQIVTDLLNCVIEPLNGKGGVYIGSLESAANVSFLKQLGINAVLSICQEAQIQYSQYDQMTHMVLPCMDEEHVDIMTLFKTSHDFISKARLNGNVLVHCIVGVSRSATILLSYLMSKWQMSLEESLKHLSTVRPIINPNAGFIQQLLEFEILLYGKVFSRLTQQLTHHYQVQLSNPKYMPDRPSYNIVKSSPISSLDSLHQSPTLKKHQTSSRTASPLHMTPSDKSTQINSFSTSSPKLLKVNLNAGPYAVPFGFHR